MVFQSLVFDQTQSELESTLLGLGQPKFRARQIWEWLYVKKVDSFSAMSNLPMDLRETLTNAMRCNALTPVIHLTSKDGQTEKILFKLQDQKHIEAVQMSYRGRQGRPKRITLCISSQVGCALGCTFCATGQGGFQRNLSSGEIVEQVLFFMRRLEPMGERVTNIVFMGMGEPFANYDNVMGAVQRLTDSTGIGLGARRLTISTVGLVPQIERFAAERSQVNLAISLHAATDELRSRTMPINHRFPIPVLLKACRHYTEETHRRISFEWAMINHVNDTEEQAVALGEQIKGMLCHVNLIPLNPTAGYKGNPSDPERIKRFRDILDRYGIPNSMRARKGVDINAACGQLSQHHEQNSF